MSDSKKLSKIELLEELDKIEKEERKLKKAWDNYFQLDSDKTLEIELKTRNFKKGQYQHDNGNITEIKYVSGALVLRVYLVLCAHMKADQTLRRSMDSPKKITAYFNTNASHINEALMWLANEGFLALPDVDNNDDSNNGILTKCNLIFDKLLKTKEIAFEKLNAQTSNVYYGK